MKSAVLAPGITDGTRYSIAIADCGGFTDGETDQDICGITANISLLPVSSVHPDGCKSSSFISSSSCFARLCFLAWVVVEPKTNRMVG